MGYCVLLNDYHQGEEGVFRMQSPSIHQNCRTSRRGTGYSWQGNFCYEVYRIFCEVSRTSVVPNQGSIHKEPSCKNISSCPLESKPEYVNYVMAAKCTGYT